MQASPAQQTSEEDDHDDVDELSLALEREIADVIDLLNDSIEGSKAFLGGVSRQGAR